MKKKILLILFFTFFLSSQCLANGNFFIGAGPFAGIQPLRGIPFGFSPFIIFEDELFFFVDQSSPWLWSGWYPYYPYYSYPSYRKSPYPQEIKPAGILAIEVPNQESFVLIDGYPITERKGLLFEVTLLAGKHQVEVRQEGYKTYREETEVKPATKTYLIVKLERF